MDAPEPEWSDLKILLALGRGGSVAAAARALGVDHSTVSRRLGALETTLGACLIVRGGREFTWTSAGRTMLEAAESVAALVENATRDVRSSKQGVEGTVRLSLPPGLSSVMSRLLIAERERRPELAIELCGENRTVDLAKGEADLALRMFRPSEPGLVCRQVLEFGWVACASQAYIAAHGAPDTPEQLGCHQLVRYVESMRRVTGPRWLEEHRGNARISVQVDNTEVAGHSIASGAGVGVVPVFVEKGRADLVRVFPKPVATTSGFIVYHESMRDTARVRAAIELLVEVIERNAKLFND